MGSDRICEIIGVKVNDEFAYGNSIFKITEEGYIKEWDPHTSGWIIASGKTICDIIAADLTFWTMEDKTAANDALYILHYNRVYRDDTGTAYLTNEKDYAAAIRSLDNVELKEGTFPSVKKKEIFSLIEIIDGKTKGK